jgi:uncharacterized DUF497 family protein
MSKLVMSGMSVALAAQATHTKVYGRVGRRAPLKFIGDGRMLFVTYTIRGEIARIISARGAVPR